MSSLELEAARLPYWRDIYHYYDDDKRKFTKNQAKRLTIDILQNYLLPYENFCIWSSIGNR